MAMFLVVSHGLSISALLATLFDDFKVPEGGLKNASVTTIHYKMASILWIKSMMSAT